MSAVAAGAWALRKRAVEYGPGPEPEFDGQAVDTGAVRLLLPGLTVAAVSP